MSTLNLTHTYCTPEYELSANQVVTCFKSVNTKVIFDWTELAEISMLAKKFLDCFNIFQLQNGFCVISHV